MKTIRSNVKSFAILLSILFLYQSCRVYHSKPVSLDQAVREGKRVKIHAKDNKIFKYKKIVCENGKFYGVKNKSKRVLIDSIMVKKVRLHNKGLSIVLGIATSIIIVATVFAIGFSTGSTGSSWNFGTFFN